MAAIILNEMYEFRMVTLSNGTILPLLDLLDEKPPVTGRFRWQRPVTRSFDVFFICA